MCILYNSHGSFGFFQDQLRVAPDESQICLTFEVARVLLWDVFLLKFVSIQLMSQLYLNFSRVNFHLSSSKARCRDLNRQEHLLRSDNRLLLSA